MKYKLVKKNLVEKNNMSLPLFLRNNYYQASSTNSLIKPYINSKLLEVNNRYNNGDEGIIKSSIEEGRIKIKQNSNPIKNKYLKYLRKPIKFTFISTDHNKEKIDTFFNDLKNEIYSKIKLNNKNSLSLELKSKSKLNKVTDKYKLKIINIFNTNSDLFTFENYL
jgi:hypothetical protein